MRASGKINGRGGNRLRGQRKTTCSTKPLSQNIDKMTIFTRKRQCMATLTAKVPVFPVGRIAFQTCHHNLNSHIPVVVPSLKIAPGVQMVKWRKSSQGQGSFF